MRSVTVRLTEIEADGLVALAEHERRAARDQAAVLLTAAIRRELKRVGLPDPKPRPRTPPRVY